MDHKDLVIEHMKRTLESLERTLRDAGSVEFASYHNQRDRQLAAEFIKMANFAADSLSFAEEVLQ